MKKKLFLIIVFCLLLIITACGQGPYNLQVGNPAPDFSLVDRQGKTWTLTELKGQVVFINFWATWCPPCLEELPSMQRLFTKLPKNSFKMLAILSKDLPSQADSVAKQKGITIPILDDASNEAGSKYRVTGLPETFIIDKQGIIREKIIGPAQWDTPASIQMLMKYINQ